MTTLSTFLNPQSAISDVDDMPDYISHPAHMYCPPVLNPTKRWNDIRYILGDDAIIQHLSAEEFQRSYPEAWRNPLTLYKHPFQNGNPAVAPRERKLLFIHPQKTAGSTLTYMMRTNVRSIAFRNDFCNVRSISPELVLELFDELSPLDQTNEIQKWSRYDASAGHGIYGVHRLFNVPYEYMTILRHPIERFLSYYRFMRMEKDSMNDEERQLREIALRLSPLEFLHDPHFSAYHTSLHSYARIYSGYTHPPGKLSLAQQECMYRIAKKTLASMETILIAEAFDLSAKLLQRKFGWEDALFFGAKSEPREDQVVGHQTKHAVPIADLTSEERRALEDFFHHDIALYEQAVDAFTADVRSHGLSDMLPTTLHQGVRSYAAVPPAPQLPHMRAGIHETAFGTLDFGSIWVKMAQKEGIDPLIVDTTARHMLRREKRNVQSLLHEMQTRLYASVELTQAWLHYYHSESAYLDVFERDCYGLRPLHDAGFKASTVVDIGAHVGIFSLFASTLWPEAKIISVEASEPDIHEEHVLSTLRNNTRGKSGISVCRAAVIGMPMHIAEDVLQDALQKDSVPHWLERGLRGDRQYSEVIAMRGISPISVATLLERYHLHSIDLLKLSCDGAETNILLECKTLDVLPMIGEIRGRWHGRRARKNIPDILSATHMIELQGAENATEGYFRASPKHSSE